MSALIMFLSIMLLFFILIYGNYATFAWSVLKYTKKMKRKRTKDGKIKMVFPPLNAGERIQACIPIWQSVIVRKALYGKATGWAIAAIISIVLILQNFFFSFVLPINGYVMLFAHIGFYIGAIIAFFVYGIITFDCGTMYECGLITRILCFLFPYIFCFFIKNKIPHYMADIVKQGVFKEGNGDTRIKQKSNKSAD